MWLRIVQLRVNPNLEVNLILIFGSELLTVAVFNMEEHKTTKASTERSTYDSIWMPEHVDKSPAMVIKILLRIEFNFATSISVQAYHINCSIVSSSRVRLSRG